MGLMCNKSNPNVLGTPAEVVIKKLEELEKTPSINMNLFYVNLQLQQYLYKKSVTFPR